MDSSLSADLSPEERQALQKVISRLRLDAGAEHLEHPQKRFDTTIRLEWIIGLFVAAMFGFVGYGISVISNYSKSDTTNQIFQQSIQKQIDSMQLAVSSLGERITVLSQSITQIRDTTTDEAKITAGALNELKKIVSDLDKSLAVMQQKQQDLAKPGTRGEINIPDQFATGGQSSFSHR